MGGEEKNSEDGKRGLEMRWETVPTRLLVAHVSCRSGEATTTHRCYGLQERSATLFITPAGYEREATATPHRSTLATREKQQR